ncbi:hypothetical protein DRQ50_00130 [bacterium]|nr:MAG: hypothetical protein DRQ50_00130 [bacterium]RKZ72433.1 MAG: hypothetical protein DRQ48_00040 [Gammaproteobacteria bacterium]
MADTMGIPTVSITVFQIATAQAFDVALPNDSYVPRRMATGVVGGTLDEADEGVAATVVDHLGVLCNGLDEFWFEKIHALPSLIALGNLLATTSRDIELYNAYRVDARELTAFVNNADSGVTLVGFPTLPTFISPSSGLVFQVQVSTIGPPELDGTLDFTLDVAAVSVAITAVRVVMFPFAPETPIKETLEFKTDVLTGIDGSEQRVSVRKKPRQIIELRIKTEEGHERRRLQALLNSWHPRVFGVPIWFEARPASAQVVTGASTIQVDTTYGDFRVDALAIVWSDSERFDSLEIASMTDTSLTFSSSVVATHDSNALVMPLRVASTEGRIGRKKYAVGLTEAQIRFTTLDNDSDIASAAPFSTHNSKIMLDDPNLMTGSTHDDNLIRQVDRLDNMTAPFIQFSDWQDSMPATKKGWLAASAQTVWEARQLVHELRGSQVSFYLPTFWYDIIVVSDLSSGAALIDIEHIGYSTYIQAREPNKSLWIELTDGTILTREVLAYAVVSSTVERLTVDVSWSSTIPVEDIARVSFLRLVRIAGDQVQFQHDFAGDATVTTNILGVKQ